MLGIEAILHPTVNRVIQNGCIKCNSLCGNDNYCCNCGMKCVQVAVLVRCNLCKEVITTSASASGKPFIRAEALEFNFIDADGSDFVSMADKKIVPDNRGVLHFCPECMEKLNDTKK